MPSSTAATETAPAGSSAEATETTVVIEKPTDAVKPVAESYGARLLEVARAFFPMGFIAFGGPAAHIGLFMKTFVEGKNKWLDETRFAELMSLGQAIPGPTSTQMATAMGIARGGWLGGLIAFWLFDWVGFAVMLGVGTAINAYTGVGSMDGINTFKMVILGMGPAAISQVFTAAYALGTTICGNDPVFITLALITAIFALMIESAQNAAFVFLGCLLAGGAVTAVDSRRGSRAKAYEKQIQTPKNKSMLKRMGISRCVGALLAVFTLILFFVSFFLLNRLDASDFGEQNARLLAIFTSIYKMGMTIYGGGQVVLPMLEREFVSRSGYANGTVGASLGPRPMDAETFGFGLALAQSMPGPLFNFAAFLGAVVGSAPGGIIGFLGLFGPGIMLVYAFMPFWEGARQFRWIRCFLVGANAASIGLVMAACVSLFRKFCINGAEASVMVIAMVLTQRFLVPPPVAIFSCAALCLVFFFLDLPGAFGSWCHVAKYGEFSTQRSPEICH